MGIATTTLNEIRYEIDREDRIASVNSAWIDYALANHGEALLPDAVLRRSLWDFVVDDTTRLIYRELVARSRRGDSVRFTFRCDTPATRRTLQMTMTPGRDAGVEFTTRECVAETTPYQPLIDAAARRAGSFVRMCSWCKRVNVSDVEWCDLDVALSRLGVFHADVVPPITHGMCPACRTDMIALLPEPHPPGL